MFLRLFLFRFLVMDTEMEWDADSPITASMVHRWRSYVSPFPLAPHSVPVGGAPLRDIDEELLLVTPPALIAHVQRTAAQGGLQVISPRQAPFSTLLTRRAPGPPKLGDHEVGSIADPNAEWPTMDGESVEGLLPDQPLAPIQEEVTMRPKTKTISLTKGARDLSDPILSCLIKGRAVIDILKRDDVAGGAEEMSTLLAEAWGVKEEEIMELDGYTLGVEGDLQRHAMKVDEVYPTLYAPVHVRSVISMGVSDVDKSVLMPGMAMDWRRMRVFCEAVFYLTCAVEGLPIRYMRGNAMPGSGAANRDNMLVFCPGAATAWCAAPETFSLMPIPTGRKLGTATLPTHVRDSLQSYLRRVRPVSALLAGGKKIETWTTSAKEVDHPLNETLANAYSIVSRSLATGPFRGKIAAAAVRNSMFQVLESAPIAMRTRMVRFLKLAPEECKVHLGSTDVPEIVVRDLAKRFRELGRFMRERLCKEAERRGETISQWWHDILAQAPNIYADLGDTPEGWTCVAVWTAFREPTDRWRKMKSAVTFRALASAAVDSIGAVALPPERGSPERLIVAVKHAVRNISRAFAGFYLGVSDVGHAVSKAANEAGKTRTAFHLREGAHLWSLRARSLRALNVSELAHEEKTKSLYHIRLKANPVDIALKPAPYMAFKAWQTHIKTSPDIPTSTKRMVMEAAEPKDDDEKIHVKSSVFHRMYRPILICAESTVTRYLLNPMSLGDDLEKAWKELSTDIEEVIFSLEKEARTELSGKKRKAITTEGVDIMAQIEEVCEKKGRTENEDGGKDYWEVIATLPADEAIGIEDDLSELPDEYQELILEGVYKKPEDVIKAIITYRDLHMAGENSTKETVR